MPSLQIKALTKIMPFYRIKKYRKYIHMKKRRKKMLKKERTLNLKIKNTREEKAITLKCMDKTKIRENTKEYT